MKLYSKRGVLRACYVGVGAGVYWCVCVCVVRFVQTKYEVEHSVTKLFVCAQEQKSVKPTTCTSALKLDTAVSRGVGAQPD